MIFTANFKARDTTSVLVPATLSVRPLRWSWSTLGGPRDATIEVRGGKADLWASMTLLGLRITINSPSGDEVWSGEVSAVTVDNGGSSVSVDLSTTKNAVAVVYTVDNVDNYERVITDWATDEASIARYGRREHLESMNNVTEEEALQRRDTILEESSKPVARVSRTNGSAQALLHCEGLFSSLDRRYYEDARGREAYDAIASGEQVLGWTLSSDLIGFAAGTGRICHLGASLDGVSPGTEIDVSGSTANDGSYTVSSGVTFEDPVSFTDDAIRLESSDDIYSDNNAFGNLVEEEMIRLEGVSSNDEFWFLKTVDSNYITVDPNEVSNEDLTGTTVTVTQGNSVGVEEGLTTERPNPGVKTITLSTRAQRFAQRFEITSSDSWEFSELKIYVKKVGSPSDSLQCKLYSGASIDTATILETFSVTGSLLSADMEWASIEASGAHTLSPSGDYWISIERTGSFNSDDYYVIGTDSEAGYSLESRVWNGSSWVIPSPDFSIPFQILGRIELGDLISLIVSDGIEGLQGVDIIDDLSDMKRQYRDGESTARTEIEKLAQMGGSNSQRLIIDVAPGPRIFVKEWPDSYDVTLAISEEGSLQYSTGAPLTDGRSPVGRWANILGVPEYLNSIVDISPAPIEEAEFDATTGKTTFLSRNQPSAWVMSSVEQG